MTLNHGCVYRHRVRPDEAGASVLAFHTARFGHTDEAGWRRSIDAGRVRVNGRRADADEPLRAGDALEFHRPPWEEPEAPLDFGVVLEDEHVLVVEKPAGLQVLPAGPFHDRTLARLVSASAPDRAECAPAHRLGRGTSGLIVFGKSAPARAALARDLREGRMTKTYLAVAAGELPDACIARQPLGPVAVGPWRTWAVSADGKPAATRLRVLRRDPAAGRVLVAAQPITGRANQIRIHLAACGAPLAGDPVYRVGGLPSATPSAEGSYLLHAAGLGFAHPLTGARVRLRSRPDWLAPWLRG